MANPSCWIRVPFPRRVLVVSALAVSGALTLFNGCAASRPPRHGPPEPPQPTLADHAAFFSDSVTVAAEVTGFSQGFVRPDRDGEGPTGGEHSGRPPGGHGMGPPPGGGGGGFGGPPGGGPRGGQPPLGEEHASGRGPGGGGLGAMPRQTLRLCFTNHGDVPITIAVTELRSIIGNFAPQPPKLTIAPGATASLDPVSGDAGGLLKWLDVTLTLRQGPTTESHVLHLVAIPIDQSPPPAP